ncbi:DUF4302 domain-containing protein [Chitinophaga sp. Cy-1792]|uniref:DUF4302 domain-containing protein n=1 Tax=Chitinophaga sp. Cy-1792 TaxID=2608339 RepID=UPI00142438BB|nr:DUF4302 domain-containing protein [Chitinophaga sp. Cy-1792]NIG55470.1 DUF4302 domain-containing protein [Chitinophaga sp. Cy-1792]
MKKLITCILIGMAALSACKKNTDPIFDTSPDDRLRDTLNKYQQVIMSAPYGWETVIFPKGGGGYTFYMNFTDSNRVQMYADYSTASLQEMKESSWRLKALQQPSLLFDTYSYIHVLSDPDAAINGGYYGAGMVSDFEFGLAGISGDTILLRGRFNHTLAYMVKATKETQDAYNQHKVVRPLSDMHGMQTFFQRLTTSEGQYDIQINPAGRSIAVGWVDNGKYVLRASSFAFTGSGIVMANPYDTSNSKFPFHSIENVVWGNKSFTCTLDGKSATVTETALPLVVDKEAPMKWYNEAKDAGSYWQSFSGWHVNGVEDAYSITKYTRFYSLAYWPAYQDDIDLMPLIVVNAAGTSVTINYGVGMEGPPTVDNNGFMHFSLYGYLGTKPSPATYINNTENKFYDAAGFYFVQLQAGYYAQVSAADGKAWVIWQR